MIFSRFLANKLHDAFCVVRRSDLDSHGSWEHIHNVFDCLFFHSWEYVQNLACTREYIPNVHPWKYIDKLEFADLLNGISQANIKRCDQQFLQIFIVVLEKEFYSLTVVFFCVKLPV